MKSVVLKANQPVNLLQRDRANRPKASAEVACGGLASGGTQDVFKERKQHNNKLQRERLVKLSQRPETTRLKLFDIVELKKALPNSNFKAGMFGHIVELYEDPPKVAEVEIAELYDVRQVPVEDLKLIDRA